MTHSIARAHILLTLRLCKGINICHPGATKLPAPGAEAYAGSTHIRAIQSPATGRRTCRMSISMWELSGSRSIGSSVAA